MLASAVVVLLAFRALQAAPSRIPALLGEQTADASPALVRHALRRLVQAAPRRARARVADASTDSFYEFLQRNTNISRATKVDPADVELVDDLQPTTSHRPNVFLFVVDSMRRDYLGAYNPKVDFTPAMDAFARESIVLESAFTRYGATGLSEPSIWVGGKMIHKQYVEPFYPMNALQKLLETDKYRSYVSMDTILSTVVKPSDSITELDKGRPQQGLRPLPLAAGPHRQAARAEGPLAAGVRLHAAAEPARRADLAPGLGVRRRARLRRIPCAVRIAPRAHRPLLRRVRRDAEEGRALGRQHRDPHRGPRRVARRGGRWGTRTRCIPRSCASR